MTYICVICRESLTLSDHQTIEKSSDILVVTKCGHLYHETCLKFSFEAKRTNEREAGSALTPQICPTCNRQVHMRQLIRIYPSELEDNSEIEINKLTENVALLTTENNDLRNKLRSQSASETSETPNGVSTHQSQNITNIPEIELSSNPEPTLRFPSNPNIEECESTSGGLIRGDKVVWILDEPKNGTVKWLGSIDGTVHAGVEFEDPLGNHFPQSGGKLLFLCRQDYGRLIPVRELILFGDFYGVDIAPQVTRGINIQVGDEVVGLVQYQPERGTVKWIGTHEGILKAVVEFSVIAEQGSEDTARAVPLDLALRSCKPNHGRLIPLDSIMLSGEYYSSPHSGSHFIDMNGFDLLVFDGSHNGICLEDFDE